MKGSEENNFIKTGGTAPSINYTGTGKRMPRRGIAEQVLMAQGMVHLLDKPHRGGRMIVILDMAKAFDRVSWDYLGKLLLQMGFQRFLSD